MPASRLARGKCRWVASPHITTPHFCTVRFTPVRNLKKNRMSAVVLRIAQELHSRKLTILFSNNLLEYVYKGKKKEDEFWCRWQYYSHAFVWKEKKRKNIGTQPLGTKANHKIRKSYKVRNFCDNFAFLRIVIYLIIIKWLIILSI